MIPILLLLIERRSFSISIKAYDTPLSSFALVSKYRSALYFDFTISLVTAF